jgi:GntR family transcriptional regulator
MAAKPIPFEIYPSSGLPIYCQLIDQVQALIAGGKLKTGDLLPSVRNVAQAASINPMTVSKAYSRLEADGIVERVRGQGMKILKPTSSGTLKQRQKQFHQLAGQAIHRARQLGLTDDQIQHTLDNLLNETAQETKP